MVPQGQPDVVRLTVGYHQLEGKRLDLKKPFAILEQHHQAAQRDSAASYQVFQTFNARLRSHTHLAPALQTLLPEVNAQIGKMILAYILIENYDGWFLRLLVLNVERTLRAPAA